MKPLLRPALAVLLAQAASAPAADWPQWRGPDRDGVAAGFRAPAAWTPAALSRAWAVEVGEGHASPVVAGDRVFVFSREGEREVMRCLSLADGREQWREARVVPYSPSFAARKHGQGPKATPVVAGGRVFALGIAGHVSAWDAASGRVLWRREFAGEFQSAAPEFGASASPLVDGERVLVHVGGKEGGALTAFDAVSGVVRWRWTGDGPAYTSPVIGTFGGVRQLVTQTRSRCVALDPADGTLLWELSFKTPYEQNIVTPVVDGDRVIFGGVGQPTFALTVSGRAASPLWEAREITLYMSSPVLHGSRLHGMSDKARGSLFTLDARSGRVLWKSEGRLGENASVTRAGDQVFVLSTSGELTVLDVAGAVPRELTRLRVSGKPVWASPAFAGERLLVKDFDTLTAFTVAR